MEIRPLVLSKPEVWNRTEKFREKYLHNDDIPVNIEHVMQTLGISIIPVKDLQRVNIEGCISKNLKYIYVDEAQYMSPATYKIVRFTIAHEIGHYVLHSSQIKDAKFNSEDAWIEFRLKMKESPLSWFEWQASEFAGRILVPRDKLINEFSSARGKTLRDRPPLDIAFSIVAPMIAPKFNVSAQVLEYRLSNEKNCRSFRIKRIHFRRLT